MTYHLHRKNRRLAYRGSVLSFYRDEMELPDGSIQEWDYIKHPTGGACIVPVLPDGRILMIRQYRPAVDRETLELPAGARDSDSEDFQVTAIRELAEETGYQAGCIRSLISLDMDVSWCGQQTGIYLAEDLQPLAGQHLDPAEEIAVEPWALDDLLQLIFSGKIRDTKTVAGLLAYHYAKSYT